MKITVELPADVQTQHAINFASANEDDLRLARLLQELAFADPVDSRQPAKARMAADPMFRPAPLYITQALALKRSSMSRKLLKELINEEGA